MTHDELVVRAAQWLRNSTPSAVIITEMASGSEEADAIGFTSSGQTIIVECKATRPDFLRDTQKSFRRYPDMGMGAERWYLTPPHLIDPDEVPEGWGLLEAHPGQTRKIVPAPYHKERNHRRELGLLVSALRRIGQDPPDGLSVKAYSYQTKCRATLGIEAEAS